MKKILVFVIVSVIVLMFLGCDFVSYGCDPASASYGVQPSTDDAIVPGPSMGSDGCSKSDFPPSGTYTLDVNGVLREFIVTLPDDYDMDAPYPLIFAWHYMGGTASGIAGNGNDSSYYGLKGYSNNSAIFVAGQGLPDNGSTGWANTDGRDVAFARAMYQELSSNYCVDEERVFSTGMSYGGVMSNTVGCAMGDIFRAIAPISGMGPSNGSTVSPHCTGQVAAWIAHGSSDNIVPFSLGQASRDHWLKENGCSDQFSPTTPSPCVAYEDCDEGHPVHWCEFDGGHIIPDFTSEAIWNFFSQF